VGMQVYKREHQKRSTRVLHVMGTLGAMAIGAAAVATRCVPPMVASLAVGCMGQHSNL
jgi:hypothetical protein